MCSARESGFFACNYSHVLPIGERLFAVQVKKHRQAGGRGGEDRESFAVSEQLRMGNEAAVAGTACIPAVFIKRLKRGFSVNGMPTSQRFIHSGFPDATRAQVFIFGYSPLKCGYDGIFTGR